VETKTRISTIMLITDGLSVTGFPGESTLDSLKNITIPQGCVVNTFGFGEDHDSKLLHRISLLTQGVYYYVPTKELIHKIFGTCVHAVLSCRTRRVKIILSAQDGARIIQLSTPFQITEKKVSKEYEIDVGLMYSGEYKSILFRLSLRKMDSLMERHDLLKVNVEYIDMVSDSLDQISKDLYVERLNSNFPENRPMQIDQNLNRFFAAKAIIEAIDLIINKMQFNLAQAKISQCINSIKTSPSRSEPYCLNLIDDLQDCIKGMSDLSSFQTSGVHAAHAYASMYYMERSSGVELSKKKLTNEIDYPLHIYLTDFQFEGQLQFEENGQNLLHKYTK